MCNFRKTTKGLFGLKEFWRILLKKILRSSQEWKVGNYRTLSYCLLCMQSQRKISSGSNLLETFFLSDFRWQIWHQTLQKIPGFFPYGTTKHHLLHIYVLSVSVGLLTRLAEVTILNYTSRLFKLPNVLIGLCIWCFNRFKLVSIYHTV